MKSPRPCPSARPPPRPTSAGPWSSSAPATAHSWSRWPTSTAWSTHLTRRHRTLHNHATPWRWAYRAAKATGLANLPFDAWGAQDRHRARLGDGQGPPLHVLAQARRRPSVHPPHDAHRQLDETSMQVFWRTWPGISSWTGSLWRLLNEELMDPANSSTDLDADEVGGSG